MDKKLITRANEGINEFLDCVDLMRVEEMFELKSELRKKIGSHNAEEANFFYFICIGYIDTQLRWAVGFNGEKYER